MQKVPGLQDVRVSLKDGLTILNFKPGNAVTVAHLRLIIKNNGFVSREAVINAGGHPLDSRTFEISGTNERLPVDGTAARQGDAWQFTTTVPKP